MIHNEQTHRNSHNISKFLKVLFIIAGSISVFLGLLGVFLPLLPTTPFLLLAATCYSKSSEKLHETLLQNRFLGNYIRNYREGNGIPVSTKVVIITLLWVSIGYSAVFALSVTFMRILLLLIAAGVTIHVLKK